ncbi:MAG TPA: PQQ-binding-like beta-propeller repeat protein, partial [Planctomycetaceae bacterium]|nr:PQQ-binding-like beta-propeller repeat protein [Planctomycetaceae bacterium]
PDRTDVSQEKGLLQEWPEAGPKLLWTFEDAGIGYSSFAVVGERLYTMGSRDKTEQVICLNASSGQEIWAADIGEELEDGRGGGPRGTPAVDGDRIYAMGGQGTLVCVNAADGYVLWSVTMQSLGGKKPGWGFSESVLVDGNKVLCTPGGAKGTVAALDKQTGELIWQTKEITDNAHYVSIMPAEINGDHQYVQLTQNTLFGIKAEDGKLLWSSEWPPGRTAVVPTPIIRDNYVYISSGYGAGCKLVKINKDYSTEDVYFNQNMKNHHGGVLLVGDLLYGFSDGLGWTCQDFMSGDIVWNAGRDRSALQKGAVTYADGRLYCVDERTGDVALLEANDKGYEEAGRFSLPKKSPIRPDRAMVWTHPVVVNGKLFVRDQSLVFCYEVSAK